MTGAEGAIAVVTALARVVSVRPTAGKPAGY